MGRTAALLMALSGVAAWAVPAHAFAVRMDRAVMRDHSLSMRDFGARLWNGIAFKLAVTPGALVGRPQAVDLNRIGVPPDDLTVPPYGAFDRDDFSPGARWVQELRIE